MKYSTQTGTLSDIRTDCLVAGKRAATKVAHSLGASEWFDAALADFKDKAGQTLLVYLPASAPVRRLLVCGGLDAETTAADYRKSAKAAADALKKVAGKSAVWALVAAPVADRDGYWKASASLAALSASLYSFDDHKTKPDEQAPATIGRIAIWADARSHRAVARAVREGQALKAGIDWARDLGNQPPNVCDPAYLLREARKLGRSERVTVSALDEKRMAELGMGAFLAVSRGSEAPGRMIIVQYHGARRKGDPPVVLIGKGITFDTGGISLKPPATMDEMKFDMCGAASVLGATRAAIDARLPVNLVTIVAAAENMPSGRATRPGDIVKSYSGKTIEILNTDAEGRLVLCDALCYAARYKPKAIIDVATLTGACIIALGSHASGLFANDEPLAEALLAAGEFTGDRAWRMPVWEEYQTALKSPFADVANVGSGGAGAVLAACFLSRFVENQRWAHLDIAGTAFLGGANKGATGRPVGLLFRYLIDQAHA